MSGIKNGALLLVSILLFSIGCKEIKRSSQGALGLVVVVMDSTKWNSATANAIHESFGRIERTVPQPEPIYQLQFYSINRPADIDFIKKQRNVIIAAPLDENTNTAKYVASTLSKEVVDRVKTGKSFAFPLTDKWALDQWALILTSTTDSALAESILNAQEGLVSSLDERETARQEFELYRHGERKDLADSLWNRFGFKLRMNLDWDWNVDTTNFVSFNRQQADNNRWLWIYWVDNFVETDKIQPKYVNAVRDSITKIYVRGSRDSSFVTTEYRGPVKSQILAVNNRYALETKGLWRMENDLMGGPFVSYTVYDEYQHRLYFIEFAQFAPKYKKLRFVRQFEVMGKSFQTDTTRRPLGR